MNGENTYRERGRRRDEKTTSPTFPHSSDARDWRNFHFYLLFIQLYPWSRKGTCFVKISSSPLWLFLTIFGLIRTNSTHSFLFFFFQSRSIHGAPCNEPFPVPHRTCGVHVLPGSTYSHPPAQSCTHPQSLGSSHHHGLQRLDHSGPLPSIRRCSVVFHSRPIRSEDGQTRTRQWRSCPCTNCSVGWFFVLLYNTSLKISTSQTLLTAFETYSASIRLNEWMNPQRLFSRFEMMIRFCYQIVRHSFDMLLHFFIHHPNCHLVACIWLSQVSQSSQCVQPSRVPLRKVPSAPRKASPVLPPAPPPQFCLSESDVSSSVRKPSINSSSKISNRRRHNALICLVSFFF